MNRFFMRIDLRLVIHLNNCLANRGAGIMSAQAGQFHNAKTSSKTSDIQNWTKQYGNI